MEDKRLKAICNKLTDEELTYLFRTMEELRKKIEQINGKH
jgi:hypothetical protein